MNSSNWRLAALTAAAVGFAGCGLKGLAVNDPSVDTGNNTTQSETSVARSGNVVVVGFNDSGDWATTSSFTGFAYAHGSGKFVDAGVLAPIPGGFNLGDPSLATDRNGRFFFATLATDATAASFIGVARSTATSPTVAFAAPILIPGLDPTGFQDKEFIAVDTTGTAFDGNVYVVWTEFPNAGGTRILFSHSTNGGSTYSAPVQISAGNTGVSGATPFVGPNGALYVAWEDRSQGVAGRIQFRASTDGGASWGTEVTAANLTRLRNAAATAQCGRPALNGNIRVNEFPSMAVDMSNGSNRGTVYIAYAGDPDGNQNTGDAADVFVVQSTNGGASWSAPTSVHGAAATNGDTSQRDNFMPSLAVDGNGNVSVTFYDRRAASANLSIEVYQATSTDAGASWSNQLLSGQFRVPRLQPNFDPAVTACYMGDYNWSSGAATDVEMTWGDNSRSIVTPGFAGGRPDPDVRYLRR
jgi:hypothetical protein